MDQLQQKSKISKRKNEQQAQFTEWHVGERYSIKKIIGKGGYGSVALAEDNRTLSKVAIKKVSNVFRSLEHSKRIARELTLLRRIEHPCATKLLDVIIPEDQSQFNEIYLVMNCADIDLNQLLYSNTTLTIDQINSLIYEVALALKYLHSAKVIHRDLKPGNILLNLRGGVKVCDFGLARSLAPFEKGALRTKLSCAHCHEFHSERAIKTFQEAGVCKGIIPRHLNYSSIIQNNEESIDGLSTRSRDSSKGVGRSNKRSMSMHVGTQWYRAPEVILLEENYGFKIDIWALGCVYAELLSLLKDQNDDPESRSPLFPGQTCFPKGKSPKKQEDSNEQLHLICSIIGKPSEEDMEFISNTSAYNYVKSLPEYKGVDLAKKYPKAPADSIHFLKMCLEFNPNKRMDIDQVLNYPLFSSLRMHEAESLEMDQADWEWDSPSYDLDEEKMREIISKEAAEFKEEFDSKYYY